MYLLFNTSLKHLQKKNKKTVETNIEALNLSKFELEYDVDPLFKKNCAMFDEGRNGGVNFLSSLMLKVSFNCSFTWVWIKHSFLQDDGCQLVLDSDSLYTSTYTRPENLPLCSIPIVYGTLDSCLLQHGHALTSGVDSGLEEAEICPSLKGFSFTSWDPDDEDLIGTLQSPTKRKLDDYQPPSLPTVNEDHAFDMDAVPDYGGGHESEDDTHLGMEDIDEDEAADRLKGADTQPMAVLARSGKDLGIVELKDQLSSLPQEYSYFGATAKSAWAGPLHWRFNKPVRGDWLSSDIA